jgi:hypothetical protein
VRAVARPPVFVLAIFAAGVALALSGGASAQHARSASKSGYTAKLAYQETNQGSSSGGGTKGIVGKGTFSAKLGPVAAIAARVFAAVTGVPLNKIAIGGSYALKRDIGSDGKVKGTVFVKFKAKGLGTLCVTFTAKPGAFSGGSFVPMSGTLKVAGGTGSAARWRGASTFDQTGVSGNGVEQFTGKGSAQASTGAPKGLTAACKQVAKLPTG